MLTLAIPLYNKEQYLPQCMDSLLAQSCRDFEILLIDDGSTDHSGALCDAYVAAHPDFVRVIHKPNGGLSSARNAGIEAARGEFITFPDPDDWVEPDYTAALLELLRATGADLVCTGFFVDTDQDSRPGSPEGPVVTLTGPQAQRALLLPPILDGYSWNKLYRLSLIREQELRFREDVGAAEDLDFVYRYLAHCSTVSHDPTHRTYHYCQRPDSATHSGFSPQNLEDFRTFEGIIADCRGNCPELADAAREDICVTAVNHLWSLLSSDIRDNHSRGILLGHIRRNLPFHLRSSRYSLGRKLQALTAALSPRLFILLKGAARDHFQ